MITELSVACKPKAGNGNYNGWPGDETGGKSTKTAARRFAVDLT
jgi:hypothetical protein